MGTLLGVFSVLAICFTALGLTVLILASLKQSPIRAALMRVFGWAFAGACLLYVASPADLMPEILLGPLFGGFDDVAAALAGIASARAAWRAGKDKAAMSLAKKRLEIK